jgi:predicted DNA-binding protein (UPF0251 family)
MCRTHCPRRIATLPGVVFFKPAGIPLCDLKECVLPLDEFEALRLADVAAMGPCHENQFTVFVS